MRRGLLLLALLAAAAPARAAMRLERLQGVLSSGRVLEVVAEQALIRFSSSTTPAQRLAALQSVGAGVLSELPSIGWTVAGLPPGMSVGAGLALLRGLPGVEAAEPNHAYRPTKSPNDPYLSSQYGLAQINAFAGWEYEVGTSCRATVAVIDTGIESTHPDLSGKLLAGASRFCDPAGGACAADTPLAACSHGTRTSGIAAASSDNGTGIAGMSWGAKLVSIRVFRTTDCNSDCSDASVFGCVTDDPGLINALAYAQSIENTASAGKVVINMSLGGAGSCPGPCPGIDCHQALQTAMQAAVAAGLPIVVSAGNDGGAVNVPAACATTTGGSGIIPAGATDSANNVESFSSRGPELAANGVVAPGVAVETTDLGGGYIGSASGTSFSAPHVAGLAALILSAKPGFTPAQVQTTIRAGADNIGVSGLAFGGAVPQGNVAGAGRMNAFRSLRLAVNGTLADFQGDQKAIAFPNPFRLAESPTVSFTVPVDVQGANTKIKVYTVDGVLVRELTGLIWDGKNDGGRLVASGTYIFLVTTDTGSTRGRVALIR